MKNLNILSGFLIVLIILSCTSDDKPENNNSEKRLTQVNFQGLTYQSEFTRNITYDNNGNIIESTDHNGLIIDSGSYNSSNLLIKKEYNEYNQNQVIIHKEIENISYDSQDKISNIENLFISYNSDGSIINQNSINYSFSYSNNSITRLSDDTQNTKIEYTMTNNLFTGIKVYRNNILKSDMTFTYDASGNCISGSGPIDEGSFGTTTDDIELSVSYGMEEKNSIFNASFDIAILTQTSFENIREMLVNNQGDRYAKEIQWYQYGNNTYKETYDDSFDSDGYIISRTYSDFPDYPDNSMMSYTWE